MIGFIKNSILLIFVFIFCCESIHSQIITTVSGSGIAGYSGDGGFATAAKITNPRTIAFDVTGNMYIADYGSNCIRRVSTTGIISTVAGTGVAGFSGDGGLATAAKLSGPKGVLLDVAGNIYIADAYNMRIRKVNTSGIITTIAGNGTTGFSGDGGPATAAQLNYPERVVIDAAGNMYIADYYNNRIRKVDVAGIITTIAGTGVGGYSGDGGPATAAKLYQPVEVALDPSGNLYIADFLNNRIRKISSTGIITTVAGSGIAGFSGDNGQAATAQLNNPYGVSFDCAGNLYIVDYGNNRVRRVNSAGVISTVAGNGTAGYSGDGGLATLAKLNNLTGVAFDALGNLYIADHSNNRIRMVTSVAVVSLTVNSQTICPSTTSNTTLTASGANTYTWSTGSMTQMITVSPLTTTNYTVNGTTSAGCPSTGTTVVTVTCVTTPTVPCGGKLTGTGMGICNQYSFTISPSQTITPLNYGSQGYACTGATMSDVSFNIMGSSWRVAKHNWNFVTTTSGQIRGFDSSGGLQVIPFLASNTITPLSYSGTFVQFAINGIQAGVLLNQTTFSISLSSGISGTTTFSYCAGSASISISPVTPSTGGPWTYSWQPGNISGNPVIVNPAINTNYTVFATELAGCTSTANVGVTVLSVPTIILSPNTFICDGSLSVSTLTAGGATSYTWSNSSSLSSSTGSIVTASPASTTNYTVIGSIGASCTNTSVVTVSVNPSPIITAISLINTSCGLTNGSATVSSLPSSNSYSWGSGVTSLANTASSLAGGSYTITVMNGPCFTNTVISVLNSLPLLILSSTITPANCNANIGSISFTDNLSGSTYYWDPIVSLTNFATNLASGNYSVTIINAACTASAVFGVGLIGGPTDIKTSITKPICGNSDGKITVTNVVNGMSPYQYSFNSAGFSSMLTYSNLVTGIYTMTVMDRNGCLYTDTVAIIDSVIISEIDLITNAPNCLANDGSFFVNGINGGKPPYELSFNYAPYSSKINFEPLGPGSYTLSLRDSNNCETDYVLIMPENNGLHTLYIPNSFTPNKDKVNDIWNIKGTCLGDISCVIYNRWGEKIAEFNDISRGWDGTYKGADVPDGVYVYVVKVQTLSETVNRTGHITLFR